MNGVSYCENEIKSLHEVQIEWERDNDPGREVESNQTVLILRDEREEQKESKQDDERVETLNEDDLEAEREEMKTCVMKELVDSK